MYPLETDIESQYYSEKLISDTKYQIKRFKPSISEIPYSIS